MKRNAKISVFSVAALMLAVTVYAAVRLSEVGKYKEKLWLHRCNSMEKYDENRTLYPNVEVDVVWRGTEFDVTHDADTTFGLPLSRFLAYVMEGRDSAARPRVWIDVKNLSPANAADCLAWLRRELGTYPPAISRCVVESPRDTLLAAFTRAGFYTSCYVDAPKPSALPPDSLRGVIGRLRRVACSGNVRALSCPVWWYPVLRDSVPGIDLLTWAHRSTQTELLLYPPYREMLADSRLKVILVKRKGKYHR